MFNIDLDLYTVLRMEFPLCNYIDIYIYIQYISFNLYYYLLLPAFSTIIYGFLTIVLQFVYMMTVYLFRKINDLFVYYTYYTSLFVCICHILLIAFVHMINRFFIPLTKENYFSNK